MKYYNNVKGWPSWSRSAIIWKMVGFLVSKPKDLIAAFSSPLRFFCQRKLQPKTGKTEISEGRTGQWCQNHRCRRGWKLLWFRLFRPTFSSPWTSKVGFPQFLSQVLCKSRLVVSQLFSWRTTPEPWSFGEICQQTHTRGEGLLTSYNPQAFARP